MELVQFALEQFNITPRVNIRLKDIPHVAEVRRKRKSYDLILSTNHKIKPTVIFHEIAHIKQFELDGLDLETQYFKGEYHAGNDYWMFPWEIEARGLEWALLDRWRRRKLAYTKEQEEVLARYPELSVGEIAAAIGKSQRSVIAKLSSQGVYKAKERTTKDGKEIISKAELVGQLEAHLDLEIPSLVKAQKEDLRKLVEAVTRED